MPIRCVILCGQSPRHLCFANRVCEWADVRAIIQEVGRVLGPAQLMKKLKPSAVLCKTSRWLRDRFRYASRGEAKFFFGDETPRLSRPDLVRKVPYVSHAGTLDIVRGVDPDLVLVFGTSLIRGPLLDWRGFGIINLHGGLSPEYRGADCTFWALYNNEPEKVGCSIHFIDAGIDTGRLIAHVCPEVRPGDHELLLFWRAVQESTYIVGQLLQRLENGERLGTQQVAKGKLYRVRDRQWKHERMLCNQLRAGMLRDLRLPKRILWFPEEVN